MSLMEKNVLVKLFHNKSLQKKYLSDILPALFADKNRRLIIFIMKQLNDKNYDITVDNILIFIPDPKVKIFMTKNNCGSLDSEIIYNELFDMNINSGLDLFEEAYAELHDEAFATFVESVNKDLTYELGYKNRAGIIARARAIEKVHRIIYHSKYTNKTDGIGEAAKSIGTTQYQRFSSGKLTGVMGGFSKGFPATLIGRPSHNKSTWTTNESCWNIKNKVLNRIDIISPEEPEKVFWRRVFAYELKVPLFKMINGLVELSKEEIDRVRSIYEGKLFFHELRTLDTIKDFISTVRTDRIVLDHINIISYPKDDMYNGIINLINFEKDYLQSYSNTVIVNLSQVNTKEMKKKGRLFPCKEDAYMSTILEQASREFLSIYYPHLDAIDKENQRMLVGKKVPMQKDIIQISIEKNSFGSIGIINFKYLADYATFEDIKEETKNEIASNIIFGELF